MLKREEEREGEGQREREIEERERYTETKREIYVKHSLVILAFIRYA